MLSDVCATCWSPFFRCILRQLTLLAAALFSFPQRVAALCCCSFHNSACAIVCLCFRCISSLRWRNVSEVIGLFVCECFLCSLYFSRSRSRCTGWEKKTLRSQPMLSNLLRIGSVSYPQESLRKATDRLQKAALTDASVAASSQ